MRPNLRGTVTQPNELPTAVLRVNHHSAKHIADRYPYAAYGSNLQLEQMASRCKDPQLVTSGYLPKHKLIFAHYCSIIADDDSNVPIGVYKLDADDVERMDRREGLGRSYDRYLVTVLTDDNRAIRCFTYIRRDQRLQPPPETYYQIVLRGYHDWRFDTRRLRHARDAAKKDYEAKKAKWKAESESRGSAAFSNWKRDWDDSQRQQALPFGNVSRSGHVRVPSNDSGEKCKSCGKNTVSLVTAKCKSCGSAQLPANIRASRYLSTSVANVEWGMRGDEWFWRIKGERAWYSDATSATDASIGIVRGTLAVNLPGSSAYVPVDAPKKDKDKPEETK